MTALKLSRDGFKSSWRSVLMVSPASSKSFTLGTDESSGDSKNGLLHGVDPIFPE